MNAGPRGNGDTPVANYALRLPALSVRASAGAASTGLRLNRSSRSR
jgi:hypothetical protein